ncbi:MAG: PQQ-binding-like beta-propeller repeat protein [Actinobacteria bacterium]|nr:PQQ-binding-like beta-propeller repeat protein [Actinomycetota bacterium]
MGTEPKPRTAGLLALLATLAALVAGCGGGEPSGSAGGAGAATVPAKALEPRYIDWPFFGRTPQRTHYLPAGDGIVDRPLDPPLKQAWSVSTHGLIEFPPAIGDGIAYAINKYGNGKAVRLRDRKVVGELVLDRRNHGKQAIVTGPAFYRGLVYGAFLDGTLAAGNGRTGQVVWKRHLHAHLESSPLPVDGKVFLGTDTAEVLAFDARDGHPLWRFKAPGAIKASPSYDDGDIFVADYESSMYALRENTGKVVWRTNTSTVPPYGEGGFFSSPAIAFGDVYAARDDGIVYAFDERTGKVRWTFETGGAVYGSPAVARVPGTPPTVYIGSENGRFYALDARTGKVRWTYDVGGPVPGTATVIGHTVYVSSFATGKTIGIDVLTHKKNFQIDQAGYTPMISDGRRLILVGYFTVFGLQPKSP